MKRIILTLAITIIAATFVFGQSKDEQEIRKTLNTIADALNKSDTATLSNYYADSYTFTNAQGEMVGKAERLELIKNTKRESFSYGDVSIRVFGNTAVVNANPTFTRVDANGQKFNVKDRNTMTLVKNGGRWQIVAIQTSNNLLGQSGGGSDEQEIRKMMKLSADALVTNDIAALSNYYADGLTFTFADGNTGNKTQFLDFVKNTKREKFDFDDITVRTFGNTAVVNFTRTSVGIDDDGSKMNSKSRDTAMLAKNGGRWQFVALQISNEMANNQSETEKQIGEMMTNWGNALGRRDAAAVEKILPADFMLMSPDGKLYTNRAEYLEVVKNFPDEATITGKGEKTIVMGDTAVQTGTYSVTPKAGGQTTNYGYTATFLRRGGRWLPIAFNSRAMTK